MNCKHRDLKEMDKAAALAFLAEIGAQAVKLEQAHPGQFVLSYPETLRDNEVLKHCCNCGLWWLEPVEAVKLKEVSTEFFCTCGRGPMAEPSEHAKSCNIFLA